MSRYIFLILILGFVGGGHSKSQANSDVNILHSHVSVNTLGSTERGYLVVQGNYQSGYKILIKGGGVGDLPSYGWRFYKWSNLLQRENYCYDNNSNKHYIGKLEIQKSWWSNNDKYIDSDKLYYGGTDITWEFDIPASSWGRWDCYGNIIGDIFIGDNHESSTIATILGGFHIILPKPPTTITIMPTTVNLTGYVNEIKKTKVTISVNNPSGNTQIITATRNAGGDSNVKICFATDCQNLNTQKDIFESITTTGGDVNVEIGAISKKATDTTISLTVTVTTQ
ncbi:TPA: hypothetical protein ACHK4F_RS23000 [Escherichia coli]